MRFRSAALIASLVLSICSVSLAEEPATLDTAKTLQQSIQPGPKDAGFSMDNYFLWCSSVIKVGDTSHMFASRWPNTDKGMGAWTSQSECVRGTSKNLLGPYKFQEVVLQ